MSVRAIRILLLVDDADEVLVRARLRPEALGGPIGLHRARDEAEALSLLDGSPCDLLVVGHRAGLDGVGFLRRLRGRGGAVPAILLAGPEDGERAAGALQAGAVGVLPRQGLRTADLSDAVRFALDLRSTVAGREAAAGGSPEVPPAPDALQPRALDLNAAVRDLLGEIRTVLGDGMALRTELAPGALPAFADPDRTGLALLHLAANARDSMPGGGTLTLRTGEEAVEGPADAAGVGPPPGDHAFVEVADTSIGMGEETLARVFGTLRAAEGRSGAAEQGPGMVLRFARRSGGGVRVRSEPGRGTSWRIYLPRDGAAEPGAIAGTRAATVLVVEDETGILRLAETVLRNRGYEVLAAGSAGEALEAARRATEPVDLLVTDVVLPGVDGCELARRLAAERPGVRVLFVSGAGDDVLRRAGLEAGGSDLLRKPYTPRVLASRVRRALEGPPYRG